VGRDPIEPEVQGHFETSGVLTSDGSVAKPAVNWKAIRRLIKIVWVTAGLAFTAWVIWSMQAHGVPADVRASSSTVTVSEREGATIFMPAGVTAGHTALVFVPGGGVDPDAYLPFVRAIADAGWPVALVRLPWRVAFTDKGQIEVWRRVQDARASWGASRPIVLGGHSRGAMLSTVFASRYPAELSGLLLIGTTHPRDHDLSSLTIPVLKISGTRDCVADLKASKAGASKLPSQAVWTTIVGANHAQFGYYGSQLGDCRATISRENQQRQLRDEVLRWLREARLI
jgi:pimeloyl-ACP methyl ester carboxylesterase